ncbi:uncharacterized protein LOC102708861 [Oryza brachyantha]|uniref:uncharacterized protein LOC102708861 n=1 Tax=Oryza brachyantha TaxID=4533 RepID=UPI001ADAE63B|nr:uncharacterized protein LOC102708861 [Oryza brachyantha]
MDKDCFNMAIRMLACNEFLMFLDDTIHYIDLQFWKYLTKQTISDFHCEPCRHAKLDVKRLAKLFECWPGMEYKISQCSNVLLPHSFLGHFTLFVLDMKARTIFILDPLPIPDLYAGHPPSMPYVHKINNISMNVNLAMQVANPTWKDNIYFWNREIPTGVLKIDDWEVSGFFVLDFMRSWDGKKLSLICSDGIKLRTEFFISKLKFNENEAKENIPVDIQEFVDRIRC